MARCCSTTHFACDCVLRKVFAWKRWLGDLRLILTTLKFYADGGKDEGCMAGLTLGAVAASVESMEAEERANPTFL
jgi:hypothetical protein